MSIREVKRKGGTSFQVYAKREGKTVYLGSFPSRKEAESKEVEHRYVQDQIAAGNLPPDTDTRRNFGEAAEAWMKSLKQRKSRSVTQYQNRLDVHLLPRYRDTALTAISKPIVMDLRDELALKFAPATANGILACLSSAYTYFVDRQWVGANPCRGVKQVENPEDGYNWIQTEAEANRLLAACNDELRDMVAVALGAGIRQSEMLHLRWDDVQLDRRLIRVCRGRHGTVKSGKVRHVPILDAVLPVLRRRSLNRAGAGLVFPAPSGRVRTATGLRDAFNRALTRAGLDESLVWHDLRHTFASWWMAGGGCIFKLSRILGHSSLKMTLRYAHLAPDAFEADYGRVSFQLPGTASVVRLADNG